MTLWGRSRLVWRLKRPVSAQVGRLNDQEQPLPEARGWLRVPQEPLLREGGHARRPARPYRVLGLPVLYHRHI